MSALSLRAGWLLAALTFAASGCNEYDMNIQPTPIRYDVTASGRGPAVKNGDLIRISYFVELPDGTRVISDSDTAFQVGGGAVIEGLDQAVVGMKMGEKRRIYCPPHLHWGRNGYGGKIPPNTNVIIDVKLLEIQ